jgi:hypothetical protein
MVTPHPTPPAPQRRAMWALPLLATTPGVLLLLIAQFGIEGEQQLTVGVAGLWLTVIGAAVGVVLLARRIRRDRTGR